VKKGKYDAGQPAQKGFIPERYHVNNGAGIWGMGAGNVFCRGPRNCFEIFFTVRIKQPWISPDSLLPTNMATSLTFQGCQ
jgi:hypothetical protein